jgi:hypothetical protein
MSTYPLLIKARRGESTKAFRLYIHPFVPLSLRPFAPLLPLTIKFCKMFFYVVYLHHQILTCQIKTTSGFYRKNIQKNDDFQAGKILP